MTNKSSLALRDRVRRVVTMRPDALEQLRLLGTSDLWLKAGAGALQRGLGTVVSRLVRDGFGDAKGYARIVMDSPMWRDARMHRVPHFGVLQSRAILPLSRADYVAIQLRTLLTLKQKYPRLGLGSESTIAHQERKLSRLEVAQTWSILLNLGHLFGTYATERGLLFHVLSDAKLTDELMRGIDPRIKGECLPILRRRDIGEFHIVLACWRVSQQPVPARDTMVECLGHYLRSNANADPTRWAYKRARQLAMSEIHIMTAIPFSMPIRRDDSAAASLMADAHETFHEHIDEGSPIAGILESSEQLTQRAFFCSPDATRLVLRHLGEFKDWWATRRDQPSSLAERLNKLFGHPADWPLRPSTALQPFARLELPSVGRDWYSLVDQWRHGHAWSGWNFLATPLHGGDQLLVDIYRDKFLAPLCLRRIAALLAELNIASWDWENDVQRRALWRSIARFGAATFQLAAKGQAWLSITPAVVRHGFGHAMVTPDVRTGVPRLSSIAARMVDASRRRELEALAQLFSKRETDTPWLAFLGRTELVNKESGVSLGEFDGLCAEFTDAGVHWTALECKTGVQGTGRIQLTKLGRHLRVPASSPRPLDRVNGTKGSFVEFDITREKLGELDTILDDDDREADEEDRAR